MLVVGAVLLLALRSVFLPLKAVALVVLSLGASLGSLLLLTTTSLGARLIGASGPGDIHPIVPITIVAITVALSTDYEVILITRIREIYEATGDNRAGCCRGVEHTGGVITSAGAALMVAVFLGFAMADLAPLKQLGVGLAIAVLLDATIDPWRPGAVGHGGDGHAQLVVAEPSGPKDQARRHVGGDQAMTLTDPHRDETLRQCRDCLVVANPAAAAVTPEVVARIEAALEASRSWLPVQASARSGPRHPDTRASSPAPAGLTSSSQWAETAPPVR